jgi:PII-like signaling protein
MVSADGAILRVYLNASDKWHGVDLYCAVVEHARRFPMAGASVFSVELGYGAHRQIHEASSEYSSFAIPIVVELIDSAEKVKRFAGELQSMIGEGLAVLRPVRVVRYAHGHERRDGTSPATGATPGGHEQAGEFWKEGSRLMKIEEDARRVTVYIGSSDTWGGHNLALAIVEKCRKLGMAGATVSRGVMGFGKHSIIHRAHFLGISADLPEKIEIVDRPEQIDRLMPVLDEMLGGGLVVIEDVQVARYVHDEKKR